jgi:hypothetical protein
LTEVIPELERPVSAKSLKTRQRSLALFVVDGNQHQIPPKAHFPFMISLFFWRGDEKGLSSKKIFPNREKVVEKKGRTGRQTAKRDS